MTFANIFCSFISFENIIIDNDRVKKFCYSKRMEDEKGKTVSNQGGWQSNDLNMPVPELEELTSVITYNLRKMGEKLNFKNFRNLNLSNFWININNNSHKNLPHKHPGSSITAVYYVKVPPDSGNLRFFTPVVDYDLHIRDCMIDKYNEYNSSTYLYIPKEGDLVFFPSWLMHEVEPNRSNDERISIAFNSMIG